MRFARTATNLSNIIASETTNHDNHVNEIPLLSDQRTTLQSLGDHQSQKADHGCAPIDNPACM